MGQRIGPGATHQVRFGTREKKPTNVMRSHSEFKGKQGEY